MKKLFICLSALGLISLSSCKKDYHCDCTVSTKQTMYDENGNQMMDPQTTQTKTSTVINDTESNAKDECESSSGTAEQTSQNMGATIEQEITSVCALR